ncbi:MAG: hypothetical protein AAFY64_03055 [Pseudomonadota bacterium]
MSPHDGYEREPSAASRRDATRHFAQNSDGLPLPGVQPTTQLRSRLYPLVWSIAAICAGVYLGTSVAWSTLYDRLGIGAQTAKVDQQRSNQQIAALRTQNGALAAERDKQGAIARQHFKNLQNARALLRREREAKVALEREIAALNARGPASSSNKLDDGEATARSSDTTSPAPAANVPTTLNAAPVAAAPQPAPVVARRSGPRPPLPVRAPTERPTPAARVARNASALAGGQPNTASISTGSVQERPKNEAKAQGRPQLPTAQPSSLANPPAPAAATPAINFGEPVVTSAAPSPDVVALKLSRAPSLGSLRLSWRVLSERHGSVLQGLRPRYRTAPNGVGGQAFELIAGPVLSRAEADQLCGLLRVQDVPCSISSFIGTTL